MPSPFRSVLLGENRTVSRGYFAVVLALGVFGITVAGYATALFTVSGGIVWIPFYAALVGMSAGFWIGYAGRGLVVSWLVTYSALLGYHAEHAFFGLSRRGYAERLAYFVRVDALGFLAVEAVVIGTVAFILGSLARWGIGTFRRVLALERAGEGS